MNSVQTAVIMAAGMSRRMGDITGDLPKGLIKIGEEELMGRSVRLLKKNGIKEVIVGTGFRANKYEEFFKDKYWVNCVKGDDYETTGNAYTLFGLRDYIEGDFLLLESDLLYENRAVREVLDDEAANIFLTSGMTGSGDEFYVEMDDQGDLLGLSKDKSSVKKVDGEMVGISKWSLALYQRFCEELDNDNSLYKSDYERVLTMVGREMPVKVKKIEDLVWCEVDDEHHLRRAQDKVWPAIREEELRERAISK
jgi:2-aminoethylphosphonate-pyruvate transaminase